jgi:hypothetical protein
MLKQYNNINQNKELFIIIKNHLENVKNDKKTQIILEMDLNILLMKKNKSKLNENY